MSAPHASSGPGDTAPLTAAQSEGGEGGTPSGSHSHISPSRVDSAAVTRSPAGSSTIEAGSSPHCEVSGMLSPRTPHSGHGTESRFVYTLRRPSCRKHSSEHPRCGQAHARLITPRASRHTARWAVGAPWLTHVRVRVRAVVTHVRVRVRAVGAHILCHAPPGAVRRSSRVLEAQHDGAELVPVACLPLACV